MKRLRSLAFLGLLVLPAACEGRQAPPEGVVVRDSVGIRIVESGPPSPALLPWRISDEPRLSIGSAEGEEAELLFRVTDSRVLDDGSVLVVNAGTGQVRIYDRSGDLIRTFGREGAGPGEFSRLSGMQIADLSPDSVTLSDSGNGRLQVFGLDGGFGRSIRVASAEGYGRPFVAGRFSTGEWLVFTPVGTGALFGEPGEILEMSMALLAYAPDGSRGIELSRIPGRPRVVNQLNGGAIHFPYVPLTPEPIYAPGGDVVLVGQSGSPELGQVTVEGELGSIVRWAAPTTPVDRIWSRYADRYVEGAPEDRQAALARMINMDGLPIPDSVPVLGGLVVDAPGYTWAERYRLPWETERRWHVLDPEGRWIGDVVTPEGVTVHGIGRDHLIGRHLDALGVERVVVYDLER